MLNICSCRFNANPVLNIAKPEARKNGGIARLKCCNQQYASTICIFAYDYCGQFTSMAAAYATLSNMARLSDPPLQIDVKKTQQRTDLDPVHAQMLEYTGCMLNSAHLNDFLAHYVHPGSTGSFDYPLKLEHLNGRTCFDCLRACTFP